MFCSNHKVLLLSVLISIITSQFISALDLLTLKPFQPQHTNPLTEPWRWKEFEQLRGKQIRSVCEDAEGNMWFGMISNSQPGLLMYNGYSFTEYLIPDSLDIGISYTIDATSYGIAVCGLKGLALFKSDTWSEAIRKRDTCINRLAVNKVIETNDKTLIVITERGVLVIKDEIKHFYSTPQELFKIPETLKGIKKHIIPEIEHDGIFNLTAICEIDTLFRVFGHGDYPFAIHIKLTGDTNNPLSFQDYTKLGNNFWLKGNVQALYDSKGFTWIVSLNSEFPLIQILDYQVVHTYEIFESHFTQNEYTNIIELGQNNLLIGGRGCIYNIQHGKLKRFKSPQIPVSSSHLTDITIDSRNNLWVISRNYKLTMCEIHNKNWRTYPGLCLQFEKDSTEKWFISNDHRIIINKDYNWYSFPPSVPMEFPKRLINTSKGEIWCAGSHKGVSATAVLNKNKWIRHMHFGKNIDRRNVYEDSKGNLWFSPQRERQYDGPGIFVYKHDADIPGWETFKYPVYANGGFTEFNNEMLASTVNGVQIINDSAEIKKYLLGNPVECLETNKNQLWLGTQSKGIIRRRNQIKMQRLDVHNGLLSNNIIDISYQKNKGWWVATPSDITLINKSEVVNNCFSKLPKFSFAGELIPSLGEELYICYYTLDWMRNQIKNNLTVNQNQFYTVQYLSEKNPPETYIHNTANEIPVSGNISLSWYGVDYWEKTLQNELLYSYKLNNKKWSKYSKDKSIAFTSLPHGKHSFKVRCKDTDLNVDPTPAVFKFEVSPPVYMKIWFIILIGTMTIIILYLWISIVKRNRKLFILNSDLNTAIGQLKVQQKEIIHKNEEVYHAKLRFFTNISHELRTPLTLIYSPIEKLISSKNNGLHEHQNLYELIKTNASRLLHLVNELLEFRKIETENYQLNLQKNELSVLTSSIVERFEYWAKQKNITLKWNCDEYIQLYFDYLKVEKIISNLLSNSLKYTKQGGLITINLYTSREKPTMYFDQFLEVNNDVPLNESVFIRICDTGIGISEFSLSSIFDRFYQVDAISDEGHLGSGIGLALVKSLVLAHKGEIYVSSERNQGTEFIVRLPLNELFYRQFSSGIEFEEKKPSPSNKDYALENHFLLTEFGLQNVTPSNISTGKEGVYNILVAEDNNELRNFIVNNLSENFNVLSAPNGEKGKAMLEQYEVDLVVSDVMMPNLNGLELCQLIKTNINFSHIPVILLTAKSEIEDKLDGVKSGADLYIEKPFSMEFLQTSINNLFAYRNQLIKKYSSDATAEHSILVKNDTDNQFLTKVLEIIKQNLHNNLYQLEELYREVGMSRSSFYKKLKVLTNQSPNEFLRTQRLKKAASLLKETNLTIEDICTQVGIDSRTYFTRAFKAAFNSSPSEYRK